MIQRVLTPKGTAYLLIFILSLIVMSRIELLLYNPDGSYSDDYLNSSFQSLKSIIDFIYGAYLGLTGSGSRLLIYFLTLTVLMYDIWLWRVLNSIFVVLFIFSVMRFSSNKLNTTTQYIIAMIFSLTVICLMNISTLYWSIFWVTGSFNYLWSPVAVLICLLPFYQLFLNEKKVILDSKFAYFYIFPLLLATSSEQGSAVMLVFSLIAVIYYLCKEKRVIPVAVVLTVISSISILIHLLSPGNNTRVSIEVQGWYPKFVEMSLIDKLFEGFNWTILHHFFYKSHYLLFVLIILLIFLSIKSNKLNQAIKFISYSILSYLGLYIVLSTIDINLPNKIYIYNNELIEQVLKMDSVVLMPKEFAFLPSIIQSIILLLIPYLIYQISGMRDSIPLILIYFASLASSLLLSLSPTVYASGARVFFLSDALLIIILSVLFAKFINLTGFRDRLFKAFVAVVLLLIISDATIILSKYVNKLLQYLT